MTLSFNSGDGASVSEADRRFRLGTPTTASAVTADLGVSPSSDLKLRLVVIDGRDDRRQLMTHVLGQGGDVLVVGQANGPVSAVDAVDRLQADAVFLEIQLPLAQGLDTISVLRDDFPALGIIVCSFHATSSTKRAALDRGADAYLAKPVSLRDLRAVFRWAPRRSESLQRRVRVVEMADGSTPDRDAENGNPDRPLAH